MKALRILICEDEGLTALRYRATLQRLGHEVVGSAADGEQVPEVARRLKPDVILMDIEMPHVDGIEATRRLMETQPAAVVVISAYGDREMIEAALAAGASGYLAKPVSDDQIEPAIQAARERFTARCRPGSAG